MYSDPKDCLYCQNNQTQKDLMIEIAHLRVSRAFLFKEQTYHGRCLVAYDHHVNDLNELSDEERNAFMFAEMFKKLHNDVPLVFIPTMYNSFDSDLLHRCGADIIIYANQLTRSAYKAMTAAANSILSSGSSRYADENYCEPIENILKITDGDGNDRH